MKKFLALFLVLGLATVANAAIVPTINGNPVVIAPDTVTQIVPGTLGLLADAPVKGYVVGLKVTSGDVTLDASGITFPTAFDFAGKTQDDPAYALRVTASQFFSPAVAGQLVDNVTLSGTGTIEVWNLLGGAEKMGTLEVTQVPEPITMALLGLGGLGVLRRRHA